jgi:hypothetical protein
MEYEATSAEQVVLELQDIQGNCDVEKFAVPAMATPPHTFM